MVTDIIADMLVRLRNAQAVGRETVMLPYSNFSWEVAKVLERKGYIGKIDRRGKRSRRMIEAELVYGEDKTGKIQGTRRISKQSRRIYRKAVELQPFKHGFGVQIVSTSKGLMTNIEARREKLGGELLFEIW